MVSSPNSYLYPTSLCRGFPEARHHPVEFLATGANVWSGGIALITFCIPLLMEPRKRGVSPCGMVIRGRVIANSLIRAGRNQPSPPFGLLLAPLREPLPSFQ